MELIQIDSNVINMSKQNLEKISQSLVLHYEITYRRLGCILVNIVSRVSYCVRRRGVVTPQ